MTTLWPMKIVLGFIDSPEGWAAADQAIAEAQLRNGKIVVVNSMRGGGRETEEEYVQIREAMERLEAKLAASDIEYEVHEYVRGQTPPEDLISATTQFGAELIVIGIRRRSKTGKVILGSNALEILHDADVPVLCVKAKSD